MKKRWYVMAGLLVQTQQAILDPLQALAQGVVLALPGLLAGVVILLFGYLIAALVALAVKKVVLRAQLDKWLFERTDLRSVVGRFDLGAVVHTVTKWYVFILFLPAAADVIELVGLSELLRGLAFWIPNLIAAVVLALLGYIAAEYAAGEIAATRAKGAGVVADVVWGVILVFAGIMALQQVSVAVSLAESTFLLLVAGVVFAVSLALGLGFGLALKDDAAAQLKKLKKML